MGDAPDGFALIQVTPAADLPTNVEWDRVVVNFDDDRMDETFTLALDGTPFDVDSNGSGSVAGLLDTEPLTGFTSSVNGANNLVISDTDPFTTALTVDAAGGVSSESRDAFLVTLTRPAGAPGAGDDWELELTPTGGATVRFEATNTPAAADAVVNLVAQIDANADYTAIADPTDATRFTIIRNDATSMDDPAVGFDSAAAPVDFVAIAIAGASASVAAAELTLTESANQDDAWALSISGSPAAAYTVGAADNLATVASDFVSDFSGAFSAQQIGATASFLLFRNDNNAIAPALTVTRGVTTTGSVVIGTPDVTWTQTIAFDPGHTNAQANDVWRLDVNGTSVEAKPTVAGAAQLAAAVVSAIPAALPLSAVAGAGNTVVVSADDGTPIKVGDVSQNRAKAFSGAPASGANNLGNDEHYFSAVFDLTALYNGAYTSDTHKFTIDGDVISVIPAAQAGLDSEDQIGRTLVEQIETELAAALDGRYEVENTAGLIKIFDNDNLGNAEQAGADPFNAVLKTGGSITGVFDIDHSAPTTSLISVTDTFFDVFRGRVTEEIVTVAVTVTPTLTLSKADGTVVHTFTAPTTEIDRGSSSNQEPFFTYEFTDTVETTYVVTVGATVTRAVTNSPNPFASSFLNFNSFASSEFIEAQDDFDADDIVIDIDQYYELIVLLSEHVANKDQLNLVGKTVTLLEGDAAGTSATITGYEAQNQLYFLDKTLGGTASPLSVGDDNQFELTFDPYVEYATYGDETPFNDSYDVVLTEQPFFDVTVDVTAVPTRTFDSDLVFDPDVDFGQNDEIQVYTATPLAKVSFAGQVAFGESWALNLRLVAGTKPIGRTEITATAGAAAWTYTVNEYDDENVLTIAGAPVADPSAHALTPAGLAALMQSIVDAHASYSATVDGETVSISSTSGAAFFASTVVESDTDGHIFIDSCDSGELEDRRCNSGKIELPFRELNNVLTIELGGFPTQDETWKLELRDAGGAVIGTASADVGFRGDLATIADKWKADLGTTLFDVLVVGRVIVIARIDDSAFTATATIDVPFGAQPKTFNFTNDAGKADDDVGQAIDDHGRADVSSYLVFTSGNWDQAQSVTVMAIDDDVIDGGDALVFPAFEERVNAIRGPLSIIGGFSDAGDRAIKDPFGLPDETNFLLAEGYIGDTTVVPAGDPLFDLDDAVLIDELADHVNATTGERPGFDPRMDNFDFVVTFLDPVTGVETKLDVARDGVTADILSLVDPEGFTVGTFSGPSDIVFRGTPDQSDAAGIAIAEGLAWTQATLDLAGLGRAEDADDADDSAETWTVFLTHNGTTLPYALTVQTGDEAASRIALLLAEMITAGSQGFTARVAVGLLGDARIVITRESDSDEFQVSTSITAARADASDASTALPVSGTFTLGGTPVVGSVAGPRWTDAGWFFDLDGPLTGTFSLVVDGQPAYTVANPTSIEDLTSQLAAQIRVVDETLAPAISGTVVTLDGPWPAGQLPAGLEYSITPFNPNEGVDEADQVDTLNVSHGNSPADDIGVLTGDRLTGLGMGPDAVIGGRRIGGGITYDSLEEIFIELGSGNNRFVVESTHEGSTTITSGAGVDQFVVREILGHTEINTGANSDVVSVGRGVGIFGGTDPSTEVFRPDNDDTAALSADESDTHLTNAIGALLTVDGGTDEITGTATNISGTTLTDLNAEFPVELTAGTTLNMARMRIDVRTQADIGTLAATLNDGVPTGTVTFTANDRFGDFDVFVFTYRLCEATDPGTCQHYVATIDEAMLSTAVDGTRSFTVDLTDPANRQTRTISVDGQSVEIPAHFTDLTGAEVEITDAAGTVYTRTIDSNTSNALTLDVALAGLPAGDVTYRIASLPRRGDILSVDNSGDLADNRVDITQTTIDGIGIGSVAETQTVFVKAASGTYNLTLTFPDQVVTIPFEFNMTAERFQSRLRAYLPPNGAEGIDVTSERSSRGVTYTISFVRFEAGQDLPQLTWDGVADSLVANIGDSVEIRTDTVRQGRTAPVAEQQLITVEGGGGSFLLTVEGFGRDDLWTLDAAGDLDLGVLRTDNTAAVPVAFDATAEELTEKLNQLFGFTGISVVRTDTDTGVEFAVTFGGAETGFDVPTMLASQTPDFAGDGTTIIVATGESVDVVIDGYGTPDPDGNASTTITVDFAEGPVSLAAELDTLFGVSGIVVTRNEFGPRATFSVDTSQVFELDETVTATTGPFPIRAGAGPVILTIEGVGFFDIYYDYFFLGAAGTDTAFGITRDAYSGSVPIAFEDSAADVTEKLEQLFLVKGLAVNKVTAGSTATFTVNDDSVVDVSMERLFFGFGFGPLVFITPGSIDGALDAAVGGQDIVAEEGGPVDVIAAGFGGTTSADDTANGVTRTAVNASLTIALNDPDADVQAALNQLFRVTGIVVTSVSTATASDFSVDTSGAVAIDPSAPDATTRAMIDDALLAAGFVPAATSDAELVIDETTTLTLPFGTTAAEAQAMVNAAFGRSDLIAIEDRRQFAVDFQVFLETADINSIDVNGLIAIDDFLLTMSDDSDEEPDAVNVTSIEGKKLNNLQTLEINADSGTFDVTFFTGTDRQLTRTVDLGIDYDGDEDDEPGIDAGDLAAALETALNPNNNNDALPFTNNFSVRQHGDVFHIIFQGELRNYFMAAEDIDTTNLDGTVALDNRNTGINYYGIDVLNIDLGQGDDVANVQGTSATTNLRLREGDDRIYVSDEADVDNESTIDFLTGTVDDIDGLLNIRGGSGRQMLMISDEAAIVGDDVTITDNTATALEAVEDLGLDTKVPGAWSELDDELDHPDLTHPDTDTEIYIVGLSTGSITYSANIADDDADTNVNDDVNGFGDYIGGVTIWSGHGDDTIVIDGTHFRPGPEFDGLRTVSTLNTGLGNDEVTVTLVNGTEETVDPGLGSRGGDGFFVLNTQGPFDHTFEIPASIFGPGDALSAGDHTADSADTIEVYVNGELLDPAVVHLNYAGSFVGITDGFAIEADDTVELRISQHGDATVSHILAAPDQPIDPDADLVNGADSTIPLVVFGGQGDDKITGGSAENLIFGDRGQVLYHVLSPVDDFADGEVRIDIDIFEGDADTAADTVEVYLDGVQIDAAILTIDPATDTISIDDPEALAGAAELRIEVTSADRSTTIQTFVGPTATGFAENVDDGIIDLATDITTTDRVTVELDGVTLDETEIAVNVVDNSVTVLDQDRFAQTTEIVVTVTAPDFTTTTELVRAPKTTIKGFATTVIGNGGPGDRTFGFVLPPSYAYTEQPSIGGDDMIFVSPAQGDVDDLIIGGAGSDMIDAGDGDNIVLGDSARVLLEDDVVTSLVSIAPAIGGVDTITTGDGFDIAIGGADGDIINTGADRDVVLGDNGILAFDDVDGTAVLATIESTATDIGGDDVIDTASGPDVVIAGIGNDTVTAGVATEDDDEQDVIVGDNGRAEFDTETGTSLITFIETTANDTPIVDENGDPVLDALGNPVTDADTFSDTITTGAGPDVVFGGRGNDFIDAGSDSDADDVVVGDNGEATWQLVDLDGDPTTLDPKETLASIQSTATQVGGDDQIIVGEGDDVVIAGFGNDFVNVEADADGNVVTGPDGQPVTIGDDDEGKDVVLGDSGMALFYTGEEVLDADGNVVAHTGTGTPLIDFIMSTDTGTGGDDYIFTADGFDVAIGGAGNDWINAEATEGDNEIDVLLGDNGKADWDIVDIDDDPVDEELIPVLASVQSTDPTTGGNDTLLTGEGDDVAIGGAGDDLINFIRPTPAADPVPFGSDLVGDDVAAGDNATVEFHTASGVSLIESFTTTAPGVGGNDFINTGDADDVVFGGVGDDVIHAEQTVGDEGSDVVFGDEGSGDWDIVDIDDDPVDEELISVLAMVESDPNALDGSDTILTGNGDDFAVGGGGDDYINYMPGVGGADPTQVGVDDGDDVMAGDSASVVFHTATGESIITKFETTDPGVGGNDWIFTADGNDVAFGGVGDDVIDAEQTDMDPGADVVFGDEGTADWNIVDVDDDPVDEELVAVLAQVESDPNANDGSDTILTGDGDDVEVGGGGDDFINYLPGVGGADPVQQGIDSGDDVSAGDSAKVIFDTATGESLITSFETTDEEVGGNDWIFTADGNDVAFGGMGDDVIDAEQTDGDPGEDVVFGDNGIAVWDLVDTGSGDESVLKTVTSTAPAFGGSDTSPAKVTTSKSAASAMTSSTTCLVLAALTPSSKASTPVTTSPPATTPRSHSTPPQVSR